MYATNTVNHLALRLPAPDDVDQWAASSVVPHDVVPGGVTVRLMAATLGGHVYLSLEPAEATWLRDALTAALAPAVTVTF